MRLRVGSWTRLAQRLGYKAKPRRRKNRTTRLAFGEVLEQRVLMAGDFKVTSTGAVNEDAQTATFTVSRPDGIGFATVRYQTIDRTAVAGQDYQAVSNTLDFASGVTSKQFTVPLVNDAKIELPEKLQVKLTEAVGGTISSTQGEAEVTIKDEDQIIAVAMDADDQWDPKVRVYSALTGALKYEFLAYPEAYQTGVRVAVGEFDGDGIPDIVTAMGAGAGPVIRVFKGASLNQVPTPAQPALIREFFAYDPGYAGGVFVAVGDVNGDGRDDIITSAGSNGGPHVRVFNGLNGAELFGFFAYSAQMTSGVRIAAGDINSDGRADILTAPGKGANPHVKVFSGSTGALLSELGVYDWNYLGGVFVASGDVTGDGRHDIIVGPETAGSTAEARPVQIYNGVNTAFLKNLVPYPGFPSPVRVAAGDVDNDGTAEIITAPGPGVSDHIKAIDFWTGAVERQFFGFSSGQTVNANGVYLGTDGNVNQPPTISNLADTSMNEDGTLAPISFTIGDLQTSASNLTLSYSVSKANMISGVAFSGTGQNRSLTVTPVANAHGSVVISVRATDPQGASYTEAFELRILPMLDPPTLTAGPTAATYHENSPEVVIDPAIALADPDNVQFTGATVSITGNFDSAQDVLSFVAQADITGGYNSSTGVISLAGTATAASYQSVLRSVRYRNSSDRPAPASRMFTFQVSDSASGSHSANQSLSIVSANDLPTITAIADQEILEDQSTAPLSFTIGDADHDLAELTVTAASSNTQLVPNSSSNLILTGTGATRQIRIYPAAGQHGTATITLQISDPAGGTATTTFNLTVNTANDLPTISEIADPAPIDENSNSSVGPLAFTIGDAETAAESLVVTGTSSNTTLVPVENITFEGTGANRSVTVTPAMDQSGSALITLTVRDPEGGSRSESFTVRVNGNNTTPVAYDQSVGVKKDTPRDIELEGDDGDPEFAQALNFTVVDNPDFGSLTINGNGNVTYTPSAGYTGEDSFQFTVTDDGMPNSTPLTSNPATVSITVGNGAPPELNEIGSQEAIEGQTLVFRVEAFDPDPNDTLTYAMQWHGADGALLSYDPLKLLFDHETGVFMWAPGEEHGGHTFRATFSASDNEGLVDSETVEITVEENNLRPTLDWRAPLRPPARAIWVAFGSDEDPPQDMSFYLSAIDADSPAQTLVFGPEDAGVNPSTGQVTTEVGVDSAVSTFDRTYTVSDGTGPDALTDSVVVPFNVSHYGRNPSHAPVANENVYSVRHGEWLHSYVDGGPLLGNDWWLRWPDQPPAIEIEGQGPQHGDLSFVDDWGNFIYIADADYSGLDVFTYTITENHTVDGQQVEMAHSAKVTIHVGNPKPDAPFRTIHVKSDQVNHVSVTRGVLRDTPVDDEGDVTSATEVLETAHGMLTLALDGSFSYEPDEGFVGIDSFVFKIDDPLAEYFADIEATFHDDFEQHGLVKLIVGPNIPPEAVDDEFFIPIGATSLSIPALGVKENDSDLDDAIEQVTAIRVDDATKGTATVNADGSFTYLAYASFDGEDFFTYWLYDGTDYSNEATVTIIGFDALIDLDIDSDNSGSVDGTPEEEGMEMDDPGKIFRFNDDDDNQNEVPDWQEGELLDDFGQPVFDDDLIEAHLSLVDVEPEQLMGYTVSFATETGSIRIWDSPEKSIDLTQASWVLGNDDLPSVVYFEGYAPGQAVISVVMQSPSNAPPQRDRVKATVKKLDMIAYRPQTEGPGYADPFAKTVVPANKEVTPGVGIRKNGDNDDGDEFFDGSVNETSVTGENDLVEVRFDVQPGSAPGVTYYIRRGNHNINVFGGADKTNPLLDLTDITRMERSVTFPAGSTVWVEWTGPVSTTAFANLYLEARDARNGRTALVDTLRFYPFTSVVIVFGGINTDPVSGPQDPEWAFQGIFRAAVQEYENGYDVHMYNENTVSIGGSSTAYDEIVRAVEKRGVTSVAIMGYSQGGGATYQLAYRLNRNTLPAGDGDRLQDITKPFSIPFTAYIDAVTQGTAGAENRRPPSPTLTAYHLSFYQTIDLISGGPINDKQPGDEEINVSAPEAVNFWDETDDHKAIDDDPKVLTRIKTRLENRVNR